MKNCIAMIAAGMMFASAGLVGAATEIDFMFPAPLLNDASLTPLQAAETAQKEADALLAPYVAKTTLALP